MVCPSVRGDNPRAIVSDLSAVKTDKQYYNILYHLHHCRPRKLRDI